MVSVTESQICKSDAPVSNQLNTQSERRFANSVKLIAGLEVSPPQGNHLSLPEYLFRGNDGTKLRFHGK